ncbi:hypothetical protein D9M72_554090 [compost metagenome]
MIGDRLEFRRPPAVLMVGDDSDDLGIQPADTDLVEQVQQRMVEFRHQDDDLGLARGFRQRGAHLEPVDGRLQRPLDIIPRHALGRLEGDAHEETVGVPIPELAALGNVCAKGGQLRRDRGDDARLVVAGQHKDECVDGHGLLRSAVLPARSRPSRSLPRGRRGQPQQPMWRAAALSLIMIRRQAEGGRRGRLLQE